MSPVTQRVALIGSGFIGQVHAANLAAHPGAHLALVCDLDAARRSSVRRINENTVQRAVFFYLRP